MEFKTDGLNLDAFKSIITPKNTPLILTCVHLELSGNTLTAKGYNGITALKQTFNVEGIEDGVSLVEFQPFSKLSRSKTHVYTGTNLTVKGRTTTSIPLGDLRQYPDMPTFRPLQTIKVDPVTFTQGVEKASKIISGAGEDLNFAFFNGRDLVAMDGNSQNARRVLVSEIADSLNFAIDARLLGSIKFGTDDITIHLGTNATVLQVGTKTYLTPLANSDLPDYQGILKSPKPINFTVNKSELVSILSDLAVVGDILSVNVSDVVELVCKTDRGMSNGVLRGQVEGVGRANFDLRYFQAGVQMVTDTVVNVEMLVSDQLNLAVINGFNFKYIFVGRK